MSVGDPCASIDALVRVVTSVGNMAKLRAVTDDELRGIERLDAKAAAICQASAIPLMFRIVVNVNLEVTRMRESCQWDVTIAPSRGRIAVQHSSSSRGFSL